MSMTMKKMAIFKIKIIIKSLNSYYFLLIVFFCYLVRQYHHYHHHYSGTTEQLIQSKEKKWEFFFTENFKSWFSWNFMTILTFHPFFQELSPFFLETSSIIEFNEWWKFFFVKKKHDEKTSEQLTLSFEFFFMCVSWVIKIQSQHERSTSITLGFRIKVKKRSTLSNIHGGCCHWINHHFTYLRKFYFFLVFFIIIIILSSLSSLLEIFFFVCLCMCILHLFFLWSNTMHE